ncbi:MAG: DUF58 domain-containing protein [Lachnospiraceae bacterium]|nr:DUF58 domain-containing protein [Lachnospiraceae bacterium]
MMKYVTKIKAKISIHSSRRTSNILDGSYKSIYSGNGFDFENLREYIPGDNVRDIDWKASSRNRSLLVKRYVAEKKHNIMLVFDTGRKMLADTPCMQTKKEVCLNAGGTIGYLAGKNGDNIGAIYSTNGMVQYHELRGGLYNLERILTDYDKENYSDYSGDLEKSLNYIIKNIRRKMIIFVLSDDTGIHSVSDDTLKKLACQHNVLFISIGDVNLTMGEAYHMDTSAYIPDFLTANKKLNKLELDTRQKLKEENKARLLRYQIISTQIDSEEEIVNKIIELLERHKYANNC